jgi:hypothetical protein
VAVLGTIDDLSPSPVMLEISFALATDLLRKRCGEDFVVELRAPTVEDIEAQLEELSGRIATFIYVGHGSPQGLVPSPREGTVFNPDIAQRSFAKAAPVSLHLHTCHQSAPAIRTRWEQTVSGSGLDRCTRNDQRRSRCS